MVKMWMLDVAREQCFTYEHLSEICRRTLKAGYDKLGLYLEHRFQYPSVPWAPGVDSLTPSTVKQLQKEFPELDLVPFINLLGHTEGFLYTEQGRKFAENRFSGLQACPSNSEFRAFAKGLIQDTLEVFSSPWLHIGGDETANLGDCPVCEAKVEACSGDGKADLYGEFFGEMAAIVDTAGRVPCLWGDIFLDHPAALKYLPLSAILFDWQYFGSPLETSKKLADNHKVVLCPTLHTYNATWCHLTQAEENVKVHGAAARELNAEGVCVTTWEMGLFGSYEALLPAIESSAKVITDPTASLLDGYREISEAHAEWAKLMGVELPALGKPFDFDEGHRSRLRCHLLLAGNPFLAWFHHAEELKGEKGAEALRICDQAMHFAPDAATRGVAQMVKAAVEFVRLAEQAHQAYAQELPGVAVSCLTPCRQVFEALERVATGNHLRFGGSRADIHRAKFGKEYVERVMLRIKEYGDGSLGYLPSFEHITDPRFMPYDQGAWWKINHWALS